MTHNDHDHFDEETLIRLTSSPDFEHLVVARSCLDIDKLDSPAPALSRRLDFVREDKRTIMYPKYTRRPGELHSGPTEFDLGEFDLETIDSSERPELYRVDETAPPRWPESAGAHVGEAKYPNLGYLITSQSTGLTFYHPGDLNEIFNAHHLLRGKVDVLFLPVPKFIGSELAFTDAIRPRVIIPIHYRLDEPGFPIPLDIPDGFDPFPSDFEEFRDAKQVIMAGHWYGGDDAPLERLEQLRPDLADLGVKLVVLRAGDPRPLSAIVGPGV